MRNDVQNNCSDDAIRYCLNDNDDDSDHTALNDEMNAQSQICVLPSSHPADVDSSACADPFTCNDCVTICSNVCPLACIRTGVLCMSPRLMSIENLFANRFSSFIPSSSIESSSTRCLHNTRAIMSSQDDDTDDEMQSQQPASWHQYTEAEKQHWNKFKIKPARLNVIVAAASSANVDRLASSSSVAAPIQIGGSSSHTTNKRHLFNAPSNKAIKRSKHDVAASNQSHVHSSSSLSNRHVMLPAAAHLHLAVDSRQSNVYLPISSSSTVSALSLTSKQQSPLSSSSTGSTSSKQRSKKDKNLDAMVMTTFDKYCDPTFHALKAKYALKSKCVKVAPTMHEQATRDNESARKTKNAQQLDGHSYLNLSESLKPNMVAT